MKVHLKGKLDSLEIQRGEKPEYTYLDPPSKVKETCFCGKKECNILMIHGYFWEAEWDHMDNPLVLKSDIYKYLRFWKHFLYELLCNCSIENAITKNEILELLMIINNRIDKWYEIQLQLEKYVFRYTISNLHI